MKLLIEISNAFPCNWDDFKRSTVDDISLLLRETFEVFRRDIFSVLKLFNIKLIRASKNIQHNQTYSRYDFNLVGLEGDSPL